MCIQIVLHFKELSSEISTNEYFCRMMRMIAKMNLAQENMTCFHQQQSPYNMFYCNFCMLQTIADTNYKKILTLKDKSGVGTIVNYVTDYTVMNDA